MRFLFVHTNNDEESGKESRRADDAGTHTRSFPLPHLDLWWVHILCLCSFVIYVLTYIADSKLRSLSSVVLSTGLPAPQICISISARRFSTSHCCRLSLALSEEFSDSSISNLSRNLLISATSASAGGKFFIGVAIIGSLVAGEPLRLHGPPVAIIWTEKREENEILLGIS